MKLVKPVRPMILILVITLALAAFTPTAALAKEETPKAPTIVETALSVNQSTGEFSTLIAALKAAGLIKKFNGENNFTVFAPTDAAFAKLGLNADNIGSLPKARLAKILQYHVARGSRYSGGVVSAERVRMLNGDYASVALKGDGAYLDNSKIVTTNIKTGNGVIHVIDTVLLPPAK